jgi:hypothetical protein
MADFLKTHEYTSGNTAITQAFTGFSTWEKRGELFLKGSLILLLTNK